VALLGWLLGLLFGVGFDPLATVGLRAAVDRERGHGRMDLFED
jgi:hypothetical protein